MSDRTLVVIDGTNMLIRSYGAYADLRSPSGAPTGAVFGIAWRLREALDRFKPGAAICFWDGGRSAWRREVYPGYKDRPATSESPDLRDCFAQRKPAQDFLASLGVDQGEIKGVEADDLIAHAALDKQFQHFDHVVILSTDRDFYQLISKRVSVWTVAAKEPKCMTVETFCRNEPSTRGCATPGEWHAFRIVTGDGADMIPSAMPGIGEKKFPAVYRVLRAMGYDGDALDFFVGGDGVGVRCAPGDEKIADRVAGSWAALKRNALLMDLRFAAQMLPKSPMSAVREGRWDSRAVEREASKMNMQSVLRDWTKWTKAFGHLAESKDARLREVRAASFGKGSR